MRFAYALAHDVYAACDQGVAILLDLKGNRYWAIDQEALRLGATASAGATSMLERGLLRKSIDNDHGQVWPTVAPSSARIAYEPEIDLAAMTAGDAWRFLGSCLWAEFIVRGGRLDAAGAWLSGKRGLRPASEDLRKCVAQFDCYRPVWPRKQICLFDCLALSHFLIAAGHAPELVFGVRVRPFSAHCWIECDGWVVNDLTGQFASYAPICRL